MKGKKEGYLVGSDEVEPDLASGDWLLDHFGLGGEPPDGHTEETKSAHHLSNWEGVGKKRSWIFQKKKKKKKKIIKIKI